MSSRAFRRLNREADVVRIRAGQAEEDDGEGEDDRGPGFVPGRHERAPGNLFAMVRWVILVCLPGDI